MAGREIFSSKGCILIDIFIFTGKNMKKTGKLFIISAPSGAGKTTLVAHVIERLGQECSLRRVITYTTKRPRVGEADGVDYHFLSEEEFKGKLLQNYFVEHSTAYGAYYGFPRSVMHEVEDGASFIVVLDRTGAVLLKLIQMMPFLFGLGPQHMKVFGYVLQRGLRMINTITYRLALAQKELEAEAQESLFNHVIINDDFHVALGQLEKIVRDELAIASEVTGD